MTRKIRKTIKQIMQDLRRYELIEDTGGRQSDIGHSRSYQSETPMGFRSRASHSYFVR
jgi:hypothetical protein